MHKSSILRMQWFVDHYASAISKKQVKVLDVGSYDLNGSYKHLFDDKRYLYTGMDMEAGPNVDLVLKNPYDWDQIATDSFDIVISGQAFEHIEFFWLTVAEMARVLKKDGLMCIIAPHGFNEHRHPVDCYRFFTDGMVALARYVCFDTLHAHSNCAPSDDNSDWYVEEGCADSMVIAKKTYDGKTRYPDLKTYKCVPENQESIRDDLVPYVQKNVIERLWHKLTHLMS